MTKRIVGRPGDKLFTFVETERLKNLCPSCHSSVSYGGERCGKCSSPLKWWKCPKCGALTVNPLTRCEKCGERVASGPVRNPPRVPDPVVPSAATISYGTATLGPDGEPLHGGTMSIKDLPKRSQIPDDYIE